LEPIDCDLADLLQEPGRTRQLPRKKKIPEGRSTAFLEESKSSGSEQQEDLQRIQYDLWESSKHFTASLYLFITFVCVCVCVPGTTISTLSNSLSLKSPHKADRIVTIGKMRSLDSQKFNVQPTYSERGKIRARNVS
jgi:hypothetical protein